MIKVDPSISVPSAVFEKLSAGQKAVVTLDAQQAADLKVGGDVRVNRQDEQGRPTMQFSLMKVMGVDANTATSCKVQLQKGGTRLGWA